MTPQVAVARSAKPFRLTFVGLALFLAFLPIRPVGAACMTGDEYLIYQGQLEKTAADFKAQCTNPGDSEIPAITETCKSDSSAPGGICKPVCPESYIAKGQTGSGVQWLRHRLPDQSVCSLARRSVVLRAIPGDGNSEASSYAEYRSLKAGWLQLYQKPKGVRAMIAAYRKALLEVMKDPGMTGATDTDDRPVSGLIQEVHLSLEGVTKSVQALERPGTLTSERARVAQEAVHRLRGGCKAEGVNMTGKCEGGEERRYSANNFSLLLDVSMERASEKYPNLRERIEKAQAAYSDLNRGLGEMNRRMDELRMVANCRDLRADQRELATRYSAKCLAEAKCNPPPVTPLSGEWVRDSLAPLRATFIQTREEEAPAKPVGVVIPPTGPTGPAYKPAPASEPKHGWNFEHLEDMINRPAPEPRLRGGM